MWFFWDFLHKPQFFFDTKILGRGLGSTQSKGRAPNSWSTGACPCGLWSMTSKPFLSVHTGRLLPASLSYGDASPSAAMETQQSVTPQDRTRDVVVNPTLIVQSLRHWTWTIGFLDCILQTPHVNFFFLVTHHNTDFVCVCVKEVNTTTKIHLYMRSF